MIATPKQIEETY